VRGYLWNASCKCPGPVSPLALSLGYVTAARNAGQPKDVTGERVNMSEKALVKVIAWSQAHKMPIISRLYYAYQWWKHL